MSWSGGWPARWQKAASAGLHGGTRTSGVLRRTLVPLPEGGPNPYFMVRGKLPATMPSQANKRTTAARAFVRSLNILLKIARMYDFGHPRTAKQYEVAWNELRTALGTEGVGLLLAVSGEQLLIDGTPLES